MEIDEKDHTDRDLIFEEKRQKALEKRLGCKFIRINTCKDGYNADYKSAEYKHVLVSLKTKNWKNYKNQTKKLKN